MEQYKVKAGDKLMIINMDDANGRDISAQKYNGRTGIVISIDDIGQLHGTWGSLAIIPGIDKFEIINK